MNQKISFVKTILATASIMLATTSSLEALDSVVVDSIRVQCLSGSLLRLEVKGPNGFEDRNTFHIVNRDWPGTTVSSNLVAEKVCISTPEYRVYVPRGANSLVGTYVTSPSGTVLYRFEGNLSNAVWLPGPADNPQVFSFADTPRLVPPAWGITPAPANASLAATSGWDTNNDAPDVYVFLPKGNYRQLRKDFLQLTGPTELVPLWALGSWDSRYYSYSEATALQQIDDYRSRQIPLDVLVVDTGWRQNASTGYLPNTNLFPDMPRFLSEAHQKHVHVVFNDHPEPIASDALAPAEISYRFNNLTQLLGEGVDAWWYDRNWGVSLKSPSANLRHEVWAMKVYQDATLAKNPTLRPMIMANVDGIDNGIRKRPPNVATHRYSIQWTGDTEPLMSYLEHGVQNAVHSGVQGLFPYVSEDLGGHRADPSPEGYIRWIEYGALSPIYRPHCTLNLQRMPWTFGAEAEAIARRYINLRYRLLPEFYAAARNNYDTGEPILRRLDLDYPQYSEAKWESQYLIGHSLLVAPTAPEFLIVPSSWLTTAEGKPGLTAAYFSNLDLAGPPKLTRTDSSINFDWGNASPGQAMPAQNWSARWEGNLTIPASVGDVKLAAMIDDGIRIWVDDQLCIDNWGANDSAVKESTAIVKAGSPHHLRVEYLQLGGNASVSLRYSGGDTRQPVWIPPGNWINAWNGNLIKGPATIQISAPLSQMPLFIRSGSVFVLAPQMQYTGQLPWNLVTLDAYPNTTETNATTLYEDDTMTTAYKRGQFRKTTIETWANNDAKTVSISIGAATGNCTNLPTKRSWVARLRRPQGWPADLIPLSATLNGNPITPIMRKAKNSATMPLGSEDGAPDSDVFEVSVPETSVSMGSHLVVTFGEHST